MEKRQERMESVITSTQASMEIEMNTALNAEDPFQHHVVEEANLLINEEEIK